MNDYDRRTYEVTIVNGVDALTVRKSIGDWARVEIETNGERTVITLRSKEAVEQLHFALSQMLGR